MDQLTKEYVKKMALSKGFKLKWQAVIGRTDADAPDGYEDLNPYVYAFAEALMKDTEVMCNQRYNRMRQFYLWTIKVLFIFLLFVVVLAGMYAYYGGKMAMERDELQGVVTKMRNATPLQTQLEKDQMCAAWLFQTNLKEARKRVCGGK